MKDVVEKRKEPNLKVGVGARYTNIEILRIVASFMVVMLHVSANKWYGLDAELSEWAVLNLYDSAVRSCVPLFFMMSGMLFLNREKMTPLSKVLNSSVLKLLVVYIFWALLYAVDTIGVRELFAGQSSYKELVGLLVEGKYHLWFLPVMIGIYLLMPVMFAIKEYKNGKYVFYTLILFFVFAILLPTIRQIPVETNYLVEILGKVRYELSGFSGYFLLGYYLSKRDYSKTRKSVLLILLVLIIGGATAIGRAHAIGQGEPSDILYGYMMLPVFLEAILIFVVFLKIKPNISGRASKIITTISKCTLGIYLIHPFLIEQLNAKFGINTLSFNTWISVPAISILVFVVGTLVILVLSKIKIVNKWLI